MNILEKLGITPGPWENGSSLEPYSIKQLNPYYGGSRENYICAISAPEMLERDINFLKQLDEILDKLYNDNGEISSLWHTINMIKSWFDWGPDQKATGKSCLEIQEIIK